MTPGDRSMVLRIEADHKLYAGVVRVLFEEEMLEGALEHQETFFPERFVAVPSDIEFLSPVDVYDAYHDKPIEKLDPDSVPYRLKDLFRDRAYSTNYLMNSSPCLQGIE